MPRFVCTDIHAESNLGSSCQCAGCQDAFGTAMLGGPAPSPANSPADIPGDSTTDVSLTVGTPVTGVLEVNGDHDWYAVDLVAGTRYQITLNGVALDGYGALEDPYLYLRNANGVLIAQNDDIRNGILRNSRINWIANETGRFFLDAGAWDERFVGGYQLAIIEFIPPTYTLDEIADFLTTGFWGDGGRRWDIGADNIITYNLTALTSAGQTLARAAFQSWANVTNLVFQEVTSGGNITFDDNQSGAFASSSVSNGFITASSINIGTSWLNRYGTSIDSYSFQTYVHEIGHALGLGHGGAYNATATYGIDNLYQNDIWSYTIMSYFDQGDANFGTYRVVMGPSLADIVAVHNQYGANTTFNSGDSVYGRNATAGSLYDFANYTTAPAFTIYDTGGSDTLDASGYGANQTINLTAEAFSSIGGISNNIAIARGVVIEGAIGGNGEDRLFGNSDANFLAGNAGADTLDGSAGNDSLDGGGGNDCLMGGEGFDIADYHLANEAVFLDLLSGEASGPDFGQDVLIGIEGAAGGQGADSFMGDAGANMLIGNAGDDTLNGGLGADSLYGGAGNDLLIADGLGGVFDTGDGDDVLLLGGTQLADILAPFAAWA
ncbi:MAG: M10 family metallopeptidase C-terminal domain-containing protein [Acetobacteraceae bacterium]|nr:M10 family metallopeptidase C-terminal domain-containing protein [Acetobacteraceae bacterium]